MTRSPVWSQRLLYSSYKGCCKSVFLGALYLCDNEAMEAEWARFPILLLLKKHLRKKAGNGASKRTRKGLALFEIKFPLVAVVMTFYHPCSSPLFLVRFFSSFPPVSLFFFSIPIPLTLMRLGKKFNISVTWITVFCAHQEQELNMASSPSVTEGRGGWFLENIIKENEHNWKN